MPWRALAFSGLPLVILLGSVGYTLLVAARLRDWRPVLFVVFLSLMAVHQTNELLTVARTGSYELVAGFGELPETAANLTASASVVLVLRLVERQQALAGRLEERIERERELRRENERLDQFAGIVSHDLRNPLNVATGNLELARSESEYDRLAAVAESLDRMDEILESTLTLARQGQVTTDLEPVSLGETAREAWTTVATGDATLTVTGAASVRADPERLRRLLENLYRNSVEHGTDGDRPAVGDVGADRSVAVTVSPTEHGFEVADDGPGIPPEHRDDVFEPGETMAADGSGFGLAIVRSISLAHGWTVTVGESASGGARFEVVGVEFVD